MEQRKHQLRDDQCPDCGQKLIIVGGCGVCMSCGYGKCG